MKSALMTALAAATLLFVCKGASGQELISNQAGNLGEITAERDCAVDLKALCAGVGPGAGKIEACMKEHMDKLSLGCSERLSKALWLGNECSADIQKFCGKAKYGEITGCMRPHFGEVGETCKEALAFIASPVERR